MMGLQIGEFKMARISDVCATIFVFADGQYIPIRSGTFVEIRTELDDNHVVFTISGEAFKLKGELIPPILLKHHLSMSELTIKIAFEENHSIEGKAFVLGYGETARADDLIRYSFTIKGRSDE